MDANKKLIVWKGGTDLRCTQNTAGAPPIKRNPGGIPSPGPEQQPGPGTLGEPFQNPCPNRSEPLQHLFGFPLIAAAGEKTTTETISVHPSGFRFCQGQLCHVALPARFAENRSARGQDWENDQTVPVSKQVLIDSFSNDQYAKVLQV